MPHVVPARSLCLNCLVWDRSVWRLKKEKYRRPTWKILCVLLLCVFQFCLLSSSSLLLLFIYIYIYISVAYMLSGHNFGNTDFHMMLSSQSEQKMNARDILNTPTPSPTPHALPLTNKQMTKNRLKRWVCSPSIRSLLFCLFVTFESLVPLFMQYLFNFCVSVLQIPVFIVWMYTPSQSSQSLLRSTYCLHRFADVVNVDFVA